MIRFFFAALLALLPGPVLAQAPCPYGRASYVDRAVPAVFVVERAERRRVIEGSTPAWTVLFGQLDSRPAVAIVPYGSTGFYFAQNPEAPLPYPFVGDVTHEPAPTGFFMPPIRTEAPVQRANYQLRCRAAPGDRG